MNSTNGFYVIHKKCKEKIYISNIRAAYITKQKDSYKIDCEWCGKKYSWIDFTPK